MKKGYFFRYRKNLDGLEKMYIGLGIFESPSPLDLVKKILAETLVRLIFFNF